MFTRIGNMILASWFLFLVCFIFLAMVWPDNLRLLFPPPPHPSAEPWPFYDTVVAWTIGVLDICIWVISATFLFDRRRFAWFGSLLGVGSAICLFVCLLIDGVLGGFSRDEDLYSSGDSFVIGMISVFVFIIIWLMISVAVFIGLIKNRKELIDADDAS
jgi:hypothetical protein